MTTLAYPSDRGSLLDATPWQEWVAEIGMPALDSAQWAARTLVQAVLVALAWPLRLAWLVLSRARWGTGETVFCTVLAAGPVGLLVRLYPSVRWPTAEQALVDLQHAAAALAVAWLVLYLHAGVSVGNAAAHGHVHYLQGGDYARAQLKRHEDAHQRVTARVGGGGSTVHMWPVDGGWAGKTVFHDPQRVANLAPEKKVAISLAGLIAVPGSTSPTDMPHAKQAASESDNPGKAMREGRKIARRYI